MIYRDKRELIEKLVQKDHVVLDIGFWGQGVDVHNENWPHGILLRSAKEVYGIDLEVGESFLKDSTHYKKVAAEDVFFSIQFDIIFAGDLIEHLVNPGLFLNACARMLKTDGKLILTTPNTFNLFNLIEKITKHDPTVNPDHTFYFNPKVIRVLLKKCGFTLTSLDFIYTLHTTHKESVKKRCLNFLYFLLSHVTDKYMETMVVVAQKKNSM